MRRFYVLVPEEYAKGLNGKECEVLENEEIVLDGSRLLKIHYNASLLSQGTQEDYEPVSVSSVYLLPTPLEPSNKARKKAPTSPVTSELKRHVHKHKHDREHEHRHKHGQSKTKK